MHNVEQVFELLILCRKNKENDFHCALYYGIPKTGRRFDEKKLVPCSICNLDLATEARKVSLDLAVGFLGLLCFLLCIVLLLKHSNEVSAKKMKLYTKLWNSRDWITICRGK